MRSGASRPSANHHGSCRATAAVRSKQAGHITCPACTSTATSPQTPHNRGASSLTRWMLAGHTDTARNPSNQTVRLVYPLTSETH